MAVGDQKSARSRLSRIAENRRWGIGQYVQRWKRWVVSGVLEVSGLLDWPEGFVVYAIVGRQIATPDPVPPVL